MHHPDSHIKVPGAGVLRRYGDGGGNAIAASTAANNGRDAEDSDTAAAGLTVGVALRADRRQLLTLAIEYACRNNAIVVLVGLVVLDRPELAVFGLVVFLSQMPLVLGGGRGSEEMVRPSRDAVVRIGARRDRRSFQSLIV